jgi:hypothetical protein
MAALVLVMPDLQKGFDIYCDTCGQGLDVFLCKGTRDRLCVLSVAET